MKFSIGIPAYKSKFLEATIQSVLSQTFGDFELIIVNDASPENIDGVVEKFSDERIKYFVNKKNCGAVNVVDNWNICLEYSVGDYFILLGDDDVMEPNYLQEFSHLIDIHPNVLVFHCRSLIIDEEGRKVDITPSWPESESVYENIYHRLFFARKQYISDFVYSSKSLKESGGFFFLPVAWGSDDITAYRAAISGGIVHINMALFNYRVSSITLSRSGYSQEKLIAYKLYYQWILQFFEENIPETEIDQIIAKKISQNLGEFYSRKRINTLVDSFELKGLFHFFFWIRYIKKYNIQYGDVLKSLFKYLVKKI